MMTINSSKPEKQKPSDLLLQQEDAQDCQNHRKEGSAEENSDAFHRTVLKENEPAATPKDSNTGGDAGREKSDAHGDNLRGLSRLVSFAQLAIALCTFVTLIVTAIQLGAMRDQLSQMKVANTKANEAIRVATRQAEAAEAANKISSEALSSSDRAWIYALIESSEEPSENKEFKITVTDYNGGKTPATHVKTNINIQINPGNVAPEYHEPTENEVDNVLFPGTQLPIYFHLPVTMMTKENVKNIKSGSYFIFATGVLTYKDVNKKDHRTVFCSYYSNFSRTFTPCSGSNSNYAD